MDASSADGAKSTGYQNYVNEIQSKNLLERPSTYDLCEKTLADISRIEKN